MNKEPQRCYNDAYENLYLPICHLSFFVVSQAQPVTRGLVGYYPFDGDLRDYSPSNNNCTGSNISYTSGVLGASSTALLCNGQNTVATTSFGFPLLRDFSISTFLKLNTAPLPRQLLAVISVEAFDLYFNLGVSTDSGLGFQFQSGGTRQPFIKYSYDSIIGKFAHVVVVRSNQSLKLFINKRLVDSSIVNTSTVNGLTNSAKFGGSPLINQFGATGYLDGVIDEMRIYNRSLSQNEIDTLGGIADPTAIRKFVSMKVTSSVLTKSQLRLKLADRAYNKHP